MPPLTPELMLRGYAACVFPMSDARYSKRIFWIEPDQRGLLPLDERFVISRSLRRQFGKERFRISFNTAFSAVVENCATAPSRRDGTWINVEIQNVSEQLFAMGFAHSVEVWEGHYLAGGLYGVALGGAFFAESKFSRRTNASKIALVSLVEKLREKNFALLDIQYLTPHLARFGGVEVSKSAYRGLLQKALTAPAEPFSDFAAFRTRPYHPSAPAMLFPPPPI